MAGRLATGTLAARGAGNPAALAAFIASRARGGQTIGQQVTTLASPDTCPLCGSSSPGLARQQPALEFAAPRYPVASPNDVLVSRTPQGTASIRHRRGGTLIGEIRQGEQGWQAVYEGRDLQPHSHQRGALAELLGTWNKGTGNLARPAESPGLQPPPVQTQLMERFGIPAVHTFAFPNTSSSSGPRTTSSSSDGNDEDDNGLGPKGKSVYAKLKAKGWDDAKAMAFAKRADNFGKS